MKLTGAESTLSFSLDSVHKERLAKRYRHPELDAMLRKKRNRKEAKILAQSPGRSPKLLAADEYSITMERIHGKTLRESLTPQTAENFGKKLGSLLATFHFANIVHGDLTTSNVMVDEQGELVLIDFGLSQTSKRLEDKAVDLHVLKETLQGTHPHEATAFWQAFTNTYPDKHVLETLQVVELRGRYKRH